MPRTEGGEILSESVLKQRAFEVWRSLRPGQNDPRSVEVVKRSKQQKRVICRLAGVGDRGAAVIAKRCPTATGSIERTIYEQVLPRFPVTAPRYYGFTEQDDRYCWLFVEDVGSERITPALEEHRVLAARWLGLVHTAAAHEGNTARLPDRGPNYYLGLLRSARRTIQKSLDGSALDAEDAAVLKMTVARCDELEGGWNQLEKLCERIPSTLVHGDFRRKNVYIRTTEESGPGLYPIDWETGGWGTPAADLALARRREGHHVDAPTYWSIVREHWPGVDMAVLEQLAGVGLIFRRLAAIDWACLSLRCGWMAEPVWLMRVYQAELSGVMQAPYWSW